MKAEIITTGTELLLGEITDTNTSFLAGQLAMLGIDLYYSSTVGDNYERMLGVLKQAWQRSDIIILTGGLGPTQGDITREVIAGLLGENMEIDGDLKRNLEEYFGRLNNIEMASNNLKQATLIPSAASLYNAFGTAPGWLIEKQGKIIVALPGPPREMKPMWQNHLLPLLERKCETIILSRNLKIWGLSESKVDQLLSPFLSSTNPTVAIYARPNDIRIRITAKATDKEIASKMISKLETEISRVLKDHIWGSDSDTLEEVVGQLLREKGLTIAIAEYFTSGLLSYTLASVPFSSSYFKGGIIASRNDTCNPLGLTPNENPSTETAKNMASLVRTNFSSDIGIYIDGCTALSQGIMTGTSFIAIDTGKISERISQTYNARTDRIVRRTINQTLFLLRKLLLSK